MRSINNMDDHTGPGSLLQRRFECFDQLRGQLADKPYSIHIHKTPAVCRFAMTDSSIKRCEQRVLHQFMRTGQAVDQRRFAGIGIADHSYRRQ